MLPDHVQKTIPDIIRRMALNASEEAKPTAVQFGTVESTSPLVIRLNQGLPLDEDYLLLTSRVKDHVVDVTVNHQTEQEELQESLPTDYKEHRHQYKGKKKLLMHYGLKAGETVLMLREQGGQRYIVLDRLSEIKPEGEWL